MVREKLKKKKEKKRSIYMEMCGTVKRKEETGRRIKKIRRRKFLSEKKKSNKKNIKSHVGVFFFFLWLDLIDHRNASCSCFDLLMYLRRASLFVLLLMMIKSFAGGVF